MAWEGTLGFRRLWRSRAKPAAAVGTLPDIYSLASDETYRGGYLITEEPDSPVMILTVPLPKNDRTEAVRHLPVSVSPEMLQAGQFYLIGGPGEESCEVVRVEAEVVPVSCVASGGICSEPSGPSATRLERGYAGLP